MLDMIDVSIIVVSWNTKDLLRACLKSVYEATIGVSFEVICVDNGSSDGTVDMVHAEFPQVTLIANEKNERFVLANNRGIRIAKGRYVLLLNADTVVLENAIAKTVQFADLHNDGAAFGCEVLNQDMSLQTSCFMYPSVVNNILAATYLFKIFPKSRFFGRQFMTWWDHSKPREVDAVSGCFSLVRRSAIDRVGLMDPIYYFYGDDIDWCYRFRRAGWSVWYFPGARIIHYGGQSSKHMRRLFRLQLFGSVLIFILLHYGRLPLFFARLSNTLGLFLRLPYWLVGGMLPTQRRATLLESAKAGLLEAAYCLFDWKRLIVNRSDVERRISELNLRGNDRYANGPPDQCYMESL